MKYFEAMAQRYTRNRGRLTYLNRRQKRTGNLRECQTRCIGVWVRTLEYAALLVGGEEQLADKVGATPAELSSWLAGRERTPMAVLRKAVDIVSDFALIKLSAIEP